MASDAPALDRAHLARYTLGDAALEAELFGLLRGQAAACLERLRAARRDGSETAWGEAAHTLKGAARGMGAMALGQACAAAERAPLDGAALALIEAETDRLLCELDAEGAPDQPRVRSNTANS